MAWCTPTQMCCSPPALDNDPVRPMVLEKHVRPDPGGERILAAQLRDLPRRSSGAANHAGWWRQYRSAIWIPGRPSRPTLFTSARACRPGPT